MHCVACAVGTCSALDKMADGWKQFKEKMKEKRIGKAKDKKKDGKRVPDNDFITVQRLSAEVSGKAQKYARVGARVFVPYDFEDFTIENVKTACLRHFAVDESMTCDVVAGEQGPSCHSFKQIPDVKVIHVRFIERTGTADRDEGSDIKLPRAKRRCDGLESDRYRSEPTRLAPSPSKFVPKSLSVVEMLKLGKTINQTTTKIDIYSFDLNLMTWSSNPSAVDFVIEKEPFGVGGFRKAFRATSSTKEFCRSKWVVKRYLTKAIEDISLTSQTVEQHTRKVVQMHYLARNFAARLHQELQTGNSLSRFGEILRYNKIFLGKIGSDEVVTVEEFIDGSFDKYINNTGNICGDADSPICHKAEWLAHYSYERSNKEVMVVDIQGCNNILFDPEIASKDLLSNEEFHFCAGNLSKDAINNFVNIHKCNFYCELLHLPTLSVG